MEAIKDFSINLDDLVNEKLKIYNGELQPIEQEFEVDYCIDLKAQKMTYKHHKIMLILFCNDNKRYVNAIPITSNEEENKYKNILSDKEWTSNQFLKILNDSVEVQSYSNLNGKNVIVNVVEPNQKNMGIDCLVAFRFCPICTKKGNCFNAFQNRWWKKLPINKPNKKELNSLISIIAKENKEFASSLKILKNGVWEKILEKAKEKDKVYFYSYIIKRKNLEFDIIIKLFYFYNQKKFFFSFYLNLSFSIFNLIKIS